MRIPKALLFVSIISVAAPTGLHALNLKNLKSKVASQMRDKIPKLKEAAQKSQQALAKLNKEGRLSQAIERYADPEKQSNLFQAIRKGFDVISEADEDGFGGSSVGAHLFRQSYKGQGKAAEEGGK